MPHRHPPRDATPVQRPAAAKRSPSTADRRQRVQSAETGMAMLSALARLGGSVSLTALANETGENAAKVHRYLSSLVQGGLVAQNPSTQHYLLGPESIRIGLAALRQCDPVRMGEGSLLRLRESLQVTCFIAVMGNLGPTVLRIEEPALPVSVNIRPGSVLPLLWSATGRAFLAFSGDAGLRERARAEHPAGTAEQRAALGGLRALARLEQEVRDRGVAVVHDTMLRGISAVSAPIFDAHGQVCAAITALGASQGFDTRPRGAVCPAVAAEALAISTALGHRHD